MRPQRAAQFFRARQSGEAAVNQKLIPQRAILFEHQNWFTACADASTRATRLNFHQRDEAVNFGFAQARVRRDAAKPQRVFAERGAMPVVTRRGRVAFVENQIDHLQNICETFRKFSAARNFVGHVCIGECAFGADDALRDRRLGHEKGACDFVGGEAADQAQRERELRVGAEHGMARRENQAEKVVANVVVER